MALVADYTSSEEEEEEEEVQKVTLKEAITNGNSSKTTVENGSKSTLAEIGESSPENQISDDEEDYNPASGIIEDLDEDIPGMSSNNANLDFFSSLPKQNPTESSESLTKSSDFVDEQEDLSELPRANKLEKSEAPLKPQKKKRKGPVKIMLPSLSNLDKAEDDDDDMETEGATARKRFKGAKKQIKSTQFAAEAKKHAGSRSHRTGQGHGQESDAGFRVQEEGQCREGGRGQGKGQKGQGCHGKEERRWSESGLCRWSF